MNYKYQLNKDCENFKEFTLDIQNQFNKNKDTIHKARNELKIINYKGKDLVVKSFKKPNLLNRFIYTFLKDSKAKKSYDYSIKIGKFTPKPISFISFFEGALISNSYFISEKFDYDFTIREPLLQKDFEDKENLFKAFANFTFDLHEEGIFHKDYSPGNILIKKDGDNYIFKIVDINRMQFFKMSLDERLKNFSKLWAKDEDLKIIAKEYAKLISKDENECISKAIDFSQKHKNRINMKKRLRGVEVVD